jgi:hypothetical protein
MPTIIDFLKQELLTVIDERNRYERERDDLLAALFSSYDVRLRLSATLLGDHEPTQTTDPQEPPRD